GGYGPAGWMDAGVHVPWTLWQAYGDTDVIRENYAMMRKYVDYLDADSTNHIRTTGGYLDWLNLNDPTPAGVVDTAFVAKSTRELAQMAKVIGKDGEAAELQQRYEAIRSAYQDAFIAPDGTVKGDSQTSYILTLTNDLEPKNRRDALIDQFVETLERRDYHLSTGFLGVDGLLPALTDAGRTDIAYRLLLNEDYPSWGYEIGWDATTVWERWNSINPDGSFNDVGMNSFNHYAYGAVGEWMYRTMAGVSAAEPGYKKVLIAPEPGDGINDVDFSHETRHGTVRSAWSTADGPMTLDVTVPANTSAEVRIPAPNRWAVTEGGTPIADVDGVKFVRTQGGDVVLAVGSGTYEFAVDKVLGDLGAATDRADKFSDDVDALQVQGVFGKIAKKHLQRRTKLMTRQIAAAHEIHLGSSDDQRTAAAVHRALASVADLDRWTKTYAGLGQIDREAGADLRDSLARIERPLSSASARLVGAVASRDVSAGEIVPGDVVRVKAALENSGKRPLTGVESTLNVPDGWSVASVGEHRTTVGSGDRVAHAYDVTVPADATASPADLTGSVSYRYTGGTAKLPVSATLMVAPGVAIDSVSTAPKAVGPGEEATVSTTLVNRTDVKQSGEVTLGLPDGWEPPAPLAYELSPGEKTTVDAVVTVPRTVVAGDAAVTASTGETPAERANGAIKVKIATPPGGSTDHVDLGNGESEQAHNLAASEHSGTNTEAGLTRRYTHSTYPGGWFEFDLDVPADGPVVVRAIETFDGARHKTYDVEADGKVVYEQDLNRVEGGEGTIAYQFVIDDPDLTSDGSVRLRFQDTGADYDPSVADVWAVPVD
ncbi:MAG: NEW3 domain-containing protein, partial [Actinomycetia bacterium]|nr:NEW3 domain-containing protein [Actinomycetes bacterium]